MPIIDIKLIELNLMLSYYYYFYYYYCYDIGYCY